MKILKGIGVVLLWIILFPFTLEARNRYAMGMARGKHCYKSESGKGIFGQSTDYYYAPGLKPEREYLTFREFWNRHFHGR